MTIEQEKARLLANKLKWLNISSNGDNKDVVHNLVYKNGRLDFLDQTKPVFYIDENVPSKEGPTIVVDTNPGNTDPDRYEEIRLTVQEIKDSIISHGLKNVIKDVEEVEEINGFKHLRYTMDYSALNYTLTQKPAPKPPFQVPNGGLVERVEDFWPEDIIKDFQTSMNDGGKLAVFYEDLPNNKIGGGSPNYYENLENSFKQYLNSLINPQPQNPPVDFDPTNTKLDGITFGENDKGQLVANLSQAGWSGLKEYIDTIDLSDPSSQVERMDINSLVVGENVLTDNLLKILVANFFEQSVYLDPNNPNNKRGPNYVPGHRYDKLVEYNGIKTLLANNGYTPDNNGIYQFSRTLNVPDGNGGVISKTFTNKKDLLEDLKLYKDTLTDLMSCLNPFSLRLWQIGFGGGGANGFYKPTPMSDCNYTPPVYDPIITPVDPTPNPRPVIKPKDCCDCVDCTRVKGATKLLKMTLLIRLKELKDIFECSTITIEHGEVFYIAEINKYVRFDANKKGFYTLNISDGALVAL